MALLKARESGNITNAFHSGLWQPADPCGLSNTLLPVIRLCADGLQYRETLIGGVRTRESGSAVNPPFQQQIHGRDRVAKFMPNDVPTISKPIRNP